MTPELRVIPLDQIHPHPDNPRLVLREDVINQIVAQLTETGVFGQEHAPLVRPHEGGYQIAAGHTRYVAAGRAGVTEIPCWVKDMDDTETFMQLVLSNAQGELSPLEIGMHALIAAPPSMGGRGHVGGLSEYAAKIDKLRPYISQIRSAAEVLRYVQTRKPTYGFTDLLDKAQHLNEISKSPQDAWPQLVAAMLAGGWSAADTAARVSELAKFDIPEKYVLWLPPDAVREQYLASRYRFDPGKVQRLVRAADGAYDWIASNAAELDAREFTRWLERNTGGDSWDQKKIDAWLADLIGRVRERQLTPEIRMGNYEDVLADLPDASVDFILTDPPYGFESAAGYGRLAKFAARVLKPGGSLICYSGQAALPEVFASMTPHLRYWWTISLDHTHGGQQLPGKWVLVEWKPLLWFVKDERAGQDYVADKVRGSKPDKTAHEWAQGIEEVFYLIEQLTSPDGLVVDPFAGVRFIRQSGAFTRSEGSSARISILIAELVR